MNVLEERRQFAHAIRLYRLGPDEWGSRSTAEDAARRLLRVYRGWKPEVSQSSDEIDIFAPTLLLRQRHYSDIGSSFVTQDVNDWAQGVTHLCLHADRAWLPDPLELLADDLAGRATIAVHRSLADPQLAMSMALMLDEDLSTLVDIGAIQLYPAMTCYRETVGRGLFGVARPFRPDELENAWPDLYVAEGLLYAKAFGSSYTAYER